MTNEEFIQSVIKNTKMEFVVKTEPKLLTALEVAKKWGCNANLVRDLYRKGFLKGIRVSAKTVRFRWEEVIAFEIWAQGKDISNVNNIRDVYTNEQIYAR